MRNFFISAKLEPVPTGSEDVLPRETKKRDKGNKTEVILGHNVDQCKNDII